MGKYYNEGYLAAANSNAYKNKSMFSNMPTCPYEGDTKITRSWYAGALDAVVDKETWYGKTSHI